MKVSELQALLQHTKPEAIVRLVDPSEGDVEISYLALTRDNRFVMLGGPTTQDDLGEKAIWDTRPEPRLD